MLSKERKYRIMNLLNERTFVTISELMEELHASRSSVNRDLIELENQDLLQRERGGATIKDAMTMLTAFNERPVIDKEHINAEAKSVVCDKAAKNIKDGDCIFIDSGTTPAYLLPHIINKRITIVTASTYLIRKLPTTFRGGIYLLGGEFDKKYDMSLGPITLDMINQFNFDHAFLSTNGVNVNTGEVYIFDFSVGAIKKAIMKRCIRNYLLIDDSKFNTKAICTWSNTKDFTSVYVNAYPSTHELPENFVVCPEPK